MLRLLAFLYGVVCYLAFLAAFVWGIGFIGNLVVVPSMDSAPQAPFGTALLINTGLLLAFAVQHSVMARPWFKKKWTQLVPEAVERSTYVLFSSVLLLLLFWLWEPMGGTVWQLQAAWARQAVLYLYGLGWGIVFVSTLLINHFDLFGLRQVYLHLTGRPYTHLEFRTPLFYRFVRHPLYLGWLMVFWSAPTMTAAHLLFAVATTAYIFLAIRWEENDLIGVHGHKYEMYRDHVPMILPTRRPAVAAATSRAAVRLESPSQKAYGD